MLQQLNFAASHYERHPNNIHQNTIVNSYVSRTTHAKAVALNALNSEEVADLMNIMPELLMRARVPDCYIEPFVLYQQYIHSLCALNSASTENDLHLVRVALKNLISSLMKLDFTTPLSLNVPGENAADNDGEHRDDVNDDDDDDRERFDDIGNDDVENDPEQPSSVNWLLPKVLVTFFCLNQQIALSISRNLRMFCTSKHSG
jgi:hypothetical protein